jgi:Predicted choline kinase involved in LPS biosynthesis
MTVLEGSLGGNRVVVQESEEFGRVVVKTSAGNRSMEMEVLAHYSVAGLPGVVDVVGFTRDPWSLTTRIVESVGVRWRVGDAAAALDVLGRVGGALPAMPVRVMADHAGDFESAMRAADDCGGWGGEVMREAWSWMRGFPRGECVMAHCDTRPENWVLSAEGPVLLDFGVVGWAPPGWDQGLFLAHHAGFSVEQKRMLAAGAGVSWRLVATVAAAWWALTWDACATGSGASRRWGEKYERVFRELVSCSGDVFPEAGGRVPGVGVDAAVGAAVRG